MDKLHAVSIIAVAAIVTMGLRFLPFLIFGENRKTPPIIAYLGQVLPYAIMGMLVVYCLKDVDITRVGSVLPAGISCVLVGALHVWKRNTLLSIGAGTVCYMLLVQLVF